MRSTKKVQIGTNNSKTATEVETMRQKDILRQVRKIRKQKSKIAKAARRAAKMQRR